MKKLALATAAILLVAGPVAAQNTTLRANFGSINLNSGFTPDPYRVNITAGGTIDASNAASGCVGQISNAPDFEVTYSAGSLPLVFRTQANSDTTLIVNGPDGLWYCDDDSGEGLNAQVTFSKPQSGTYDIWVGTYGGGTSGSQLLITELP
jgi:hypothetical protein